jgi:hypothetical protein
MAWFNIYGSVRQIFQDVIAPEMQSLHGEFRAVHAQIESIKERLDGLDKRMDGFEERMDRFEKRIDGFEARVEHRLEGMERGIARVETKWDKAHRRPRTASCPGSQARPKMNYGTGLARTGPCRSGASGHMADFGAA